MKYIQWITVAGVAVLSGCASAPVAPRELVEARAAFTRASQGAAGRLAMVDLHNAQGDLDRAERSFTEDPGSDVTRDLSYVALRRAQTVEARGDSLQANAQGEAAGRDQAALTGQQLTQTRAALQSSQQAEVRSQVELTAERQRREEAERQSAAALESLRRVAAVREDQRGTIITLSGEVLFAPGQSALLPIAQERLNQVAQALIDQGPRRLVVEGHTDSRGSATSNQDLSVARAQSVRGYLIGKGISPSIIEATGFGPTRPVAPNTTAEGRANNRRVEIVVSPAAAQQSVAARP